MDNISKPATQNQDLIVWTAPPQSILVKVTRPAKACAIVQKHKCHFYSQEVILSGLASKAPH